MNKPAGIIQARNMRKYRSRNRKAYARVVYILKRGAQLFISLLNGYHAAIIGIDCTFVNIQ